MQKSAAQTTHKPQYVDEQTYRSLVKFSVFFEVLGLVIALAIQIFLPAMQLPAQYSIPATTLLAIGLVFNIFVWRGWHNKRPQSALQIAILPPIIAILIASIATGGVQSDWYYLWLVAIVCSGIAGSVSATLVTVLTAALWIYSVLIFTGSFSITDSLFKLAATIIGLVAAFFISLGVNRTIKVMHRAENLMRQLDDAEMRTQLMMSSIADIMIAVDNQRKIVIFNETAQAVTGWDRDSALGVDYNLIFKLKDQNEAALTDASDPFLYVLQNNEALSSDQYSMLDRDNQKISFSITIAPTTDSRGQVSGAIAIFHDISDQKAVARERDEFISTASHEMRTPVAAIEGYLSMAMNPTLATIDKRADSYIHKAHDASVHLGVLFRDLLSITKIEDNKTSIQRQPFNITELVNRVVGEMAIIAKQKNIQIQTQFSGSQASKELVVAPIYTVTADSDRVREVMSNLIDNAIKYSKNDSMISVALESANGMVIFSVTDTGIGITTEDQKHLFQKFYRVNNSFTREVGGTGLGLYIARNLIEQFGGKIWVKSQEGKGSTFSFSLPLEGGAKI